MDPKTISPFQLILLVVFGVAALVGLFVFANFSGGGRGSEKAGSVVIWGTLNKSAFDAALADLATADDRYTEVTYVELPGTTFGRELADALASGTGPDAVVISQELFNAERNKLSPISYTSISRRTFTDSYVPLFELFLTEEGTYGIPLALDPLVLYYNRSILASEQVVSPPSTWEAVSGFAAATSRRTGEGAVTRSAIALGEYGNVRNARAILSLLLLQAGTPITTVGESGVRAVLGDDASYEVGLNPAESAVMYYAQFADPAKSVYSWNRSLPESRASFIAGDLALYLGFASEAPFLKEANPNLDFDMARVPTPGTAQSRVGYGLGYVLAITKGAHNQTGALSVAFALGSVSYAPNIASSLSMAPAHRSALKAPSDDSLKALYYPEALVAKGWISPAPSETDRVFSSMIADIAAGRSDAGKALSGAAASLDAALR